VHEYFQPGLGLGFCHQLLDHLHPGENDPLTGARHMREQAMLNGVVFGAVGGIMGDADFDPDFIGQPLKVLFKKVVPGTVASAAITQQQNGEGLWVVLLPVGVPPVVILRL